MSIFTTLGMFIVDENRYVDSNSNPLPPPPSSSSSSLQQTNIIGGAGTYAIMGARIICDGRQDLVDQISGIIDMGSDFPFEIKQELNTWKTRGVIYRENPRRLTTRGVNIYQYTDSNTKSSKGSIDNELEQDAIRYFEYVTPKLRIEINDILKYPNLKQSSNFHLICSIKRCKLLIDSINQFNPTAKFIYEPLPDDCIFENLEFLQNEILPKIHVFTPNLNEAKLLLGLTDNKDETSNNDDNEDLQEISQQFTNHLQLSNSGTALRCGAQGCYINTKSGDKFQLPAYHQDQNKVVDVTGGGNSFCGGFMMAYHLSDGDWLTSGVAGIISSGCIIEKLGMPTVTDNSKFNNKSLKDRLDTYLNENPTLKVNFKWI
ncbi:protein involved in the structural stability of L-A double-stranded RNA-containing particles, putative [Candida dubliniensis CD36]|uniref:Protein involved in the structural stability of L-A double-stranded RNA-containing particles, putative n=1 Tax=Candida dubliniensis (strain CD36 / ATCC MYA-646 / CBS 7987 / NCPF 3949 / NRRL Y-17841) TaxID=573826 RepID=B9W6W6_CANDC|nr:protein involved in the structural stability of L-A double-stranded RNA-containing particles, putative [Candida dubliniensis CD36]CAX44423.1 protein involved in the structural stability of L-A double-stranded RNA-containing particles, putative [Candida dubliniensis CD36]